MLNAFIKHIGLTALGLCLLCTAVEVRGAVRDYKAAENKKYELTLQSIRQWGVKSSGMAATLTKIADALPANVLMPPPEKP